MTLQTHWKNKARSKGELSLYKGQGRETGSSSCAGLAIVEDCQLTSGQGLRSVQSLTASWKSCYRHEEG